MIINFIRYRFIISLLSIFFAVCPESKQSKSISELDDYLCSLTCAEFRNETNCDYNSLNGDDEVCICEDGLLMSENGTCVAECQCDCRNSTLHLIPPGEIEVNQQTCETW